jgi:methionine sulfoxide reductase heme-binding subunit
MVTREQWVRWGLKPLLWLLLLTPMVGLIYGALTADLGPDPQKTLVLTTGKWTLYSLLLTLSVSPLRRWTGVAQLLRVRRLLGLFAFFYACLHVSCYVLLYLGLEWAVLLEDLTERPYIVVGMLAFTGLWPLALTSTQRQMRRLGRRWQRLHYLVYPIAILGWLHYLWQVKSDLNKPLFLGLLLGLLLATRLWGSRQVHKQAEGIARQAPAAEK